METTETLSTMDGMAIRHAEIITMDSMQPRAEATDHPALQAIIRRAIADTPQGELVFGMGFTEYTLDTEKHSPILEALDAVVPDNPIYLIGVTGHVSAANSRALEFLAMADDTPGIMRDADGQPSGLLADKANNLAWDSFSLAFGADEQVGEMIALAVEKALSVGITTLHALEGGSTSEDEAIADLLAIMPTPPLRLLLYYQTMDVERVVELGLPRIGGCILLDGDVGLHTAALSEPYLDDPTCQPPFNLYWPHTTYYGTLGEERAWKADPVRGLLRPGLLVAGGSDSTVTPLGPLIGVHAAVNHSNLAKRVSVQEGLQLYTLNAARIGFEEQDKGSLEAGKLGDSMLLAQDPFRVEPGHIKDIPVEMTVVGGNIAYQRA